MAIYWDPKPELFTVPIVEWPILWYGVFFAAGFAIGFPIFVSVLTRFLGPNEKKKATQITDQLVVYLIVATIVGARLGHFLFYENPAEYLHHPLEIFKVWKGGLASHGAAVAIVIAVILFRVKIRKTFPKLTWLKLLDFIAIPTALAAAFIRLGNFFNQEILGTPTNLPWAVTFGHPADRSVPIPRHPVQLYESIFYLALFFLLWRLSYRPLFLRMPGKLIGLFLVLVFGFRFMIEFLKEEQSLLVSGGALLTMGQWLSLPLVLAGVVLFFAREKR